MQNSEHNNNIEKRHNEGKITSSGIKNIIKQQQFRKDYIVDRTQKQFT